jgi:hypothetical protein
MYNYRIDWYCVGDDDFFSVDKTFNPPSPLRKGVRLGSTGQTPKSLGRCAAALTCLSLGFHPFRRINP